MKMWGLVSTLLLFVCAASALSETYGPPAVTSVNTQIGAVSIPTTQRQASSPIDATPGSVTWAFPATFVNMPTCYESLVATNSGYSFDAPVVSAIGPSSVTVKVTAHPTSLSLTSLNLPVALPLTSTPPAGTTITLTCSAPLP